MLELDTYVFRTFFYYLSIDWWGRTQAISDLFKSITSLPTDITLISLPAGPLLELICMAIQRQVTATWISLATILIAQLNPPVFALSANKPGPKLEAEAVVREALPVLLRSVLGMMSMPGAMEGVSHLSFWIMWCCYDSSWWPLDRIQILCKSFLCVWIEYVLISYFPGRIANYLIYPGGTRLYTAILWVTWGCFGCFDAVRGYSAELTRTIFIGRSVQFHSELYLVGVLYVLLTDKTVIVDSSKCTYGWTYAP